MRNIFIGFSRPREFKLGAYSIQKWMDTDYSHCYIRLESLDPEMPKTVYHAAHGMVHFIDFDRLKKENIIIKEYIIEVSDLTRKKILISAIKLAGLKYACMQLIKILFYDIAHMLGKKIVLYNNTGYICSELVGKIMQNHLGFTFTKPLFLINPKDIDSILKFNKYKTLHYIGQ